MGKYYLLSDFSQETGVSMIEEEIKRDLKEENQIVFIASSPAAYAITDHYVGIYLEWFKRIGIHFKEQVVLDNRMETETMREAIKNASLIYLMGGTTPLQMEFLRTHQLIELIRQMNCVVMGLSAGAINMAKTSILTQSSGHEKQEVYKGMGLVDRSIEPHFDLVHFGEELQALSYKHTIYGMVDESVMVVRDNEDRYYGEIYLLQNGTVKKIKE